MAHLGDTLHGSTDQEMRPGDYLLSQNGRFQCILQPDGNLVVYDLEKGPRMLWPSNTSGQPVSRAVMQRDGNFVIYGPFAANWSTHTGGQGICDLVMQNDGNLVLYKIGPSAWAAGSHP